MTFNRKRFISQIVKNGKGKSQGKPGSFDAQPHVLYENNT